MARPRSTSKLGQVVSLRLPDALHDRFYAAAKAAGVSVGTAIRAHLEGAPIVVVDDKGKQALTPAELDRMAAAASVVKRVKPPKPSPEKGRLVYLYNKASNNLNQIAHRLHAAHAAGKATPAVYERALGELIALGGFLRGRIDDVD